MISIPKAYCKNGYEAVNICAVASCTKSAFVCSHSNCSCVKDHENCLSSSSYSLILNKILEKSIAYGECYKHILKWYE